MGSRGAFAATYGRTGGIPPENRIYSEISRIGRIKVIQCDVYSNNPTTTYSNTCNTTYYAYSKENGSIEHIYYFRKHRLVKSVDFKEGETPHTHYWHQKEVGRKKHDKHNTRPLNERNKRLMKKALEYNNKKKNG